MLLVYLVLVNSNCVMLPFCYMSHSTDPLWHHQNCCHYLRSSLNVNFMADNGKELGPAVLSIHPFMIRKVVYKRQYLYSICTVSVILHITDITS